MKNPQVMKWVIFGLLLPVGALSAEGATWKQVKNKNQVAVFTRAYAGSSVEEFIGKTEVEAGLSQVVQILLDPASCKTVYFKCQEIRLVQGGAQRGTVYIRNSAPWPVNDRDVFIDRAMSQDKASKVITMRLSKNDSMNAAPPSGVTRMDSFVATWRITPTEAGRLRVEYQAHFNPGGSVPQSLINLSLVDTPYHTLENLRRAVAEGRHKDVRIDWIKE